LSRQVTPSVRRCYPCLRYNVLPICPEWTLEKLERASGIEPPSLPWQGNRASCMGMHGDASSSRNRPDRFARLAPRCTELHGEWIRIGYAANPDKGLGSRSCIGPGKISSRPPRHHDPLVPISRIQVSKRQSCGGQDCSSCSIIRRNFGSIKGDPSAPLWIRLSTASATGAHMRSEGFGW